MTVLITGHLGLVGSALRRALLAKSIGSRGLDLIAEGHEHGDVRDLERMHTAIDSVDGIIHLAAVSRVIWGEQDPARCQQTNVGGLRNVIEAIRSQARPPWLLFASSREVYGQSPQLPVSEDAPMTPVNVYGRSKVEGERLVTAARAEGLRTAIVRLSNVYGSTHDHADRVVPAFARAAAAGDALHVEGGDNVFDFTHLDDTTQGLVAIVEHLLAGRQPLPTIHLLTGVPTTLGDLATFAVDYAKSGATICQAPPRHYDVSRFYGCPDRARELLGWSAQIGVREGIARLIDDFRNELR